MSERRMFAKRIVESDDFMSLPVRSQVLYFHICMNAWDKGIVRNARTITTIIGGDDDTLQILVDAGYINPKRDDLGDYYEIVHWYENNGIGETAKKRNNYRYRQWREAVIARDKKCLMCGTVENLVAHHIKRFAEYPLLRTELSNGMTLCDKCHRKLHKEARENGGC